MVECRTPEREVRGSRPTSAVLCPWARHFTPRKYWLITQEAMAPSRHDWKIVDWDVKPQHNQPTNIQKIHPGSGKLNNSQLLTLRAHCIKCKLIHTTYSVMVLLGLFKISNIALWSLNTCAFIMYQGKEETTYLYLNNLITWTIKNIQQCSRFTNWISKSSCCLISFKVQFQKALMLKITLITVYLKLSVSYNMSQSMTKPIKWHVCPV